MTAIGINLDRLVKRILTDQFHPLIAKVFFNKWRRLYAYEERPVHSFENVLTFWSGIVNMPFSAEKTLQFDHTWDLLAEQLIFTVSENDNQQRSLWNTYNQKREQHTRGLIRNDGLLSENHGHTIMTLFGLDERDIWTTVSNLAESSSMHHTIKKADHWVLSEVRNLTLFMADPDQDTTPINVDGTFCQSLSIKNQREYIRLQIAEGMPLTRDGQTNKWLRDIFYIANTNHNFSIDIAHNRIKHHIGNPKEYIDGQFAWNISQANADIFAYLQDHPDDTFAQAVQARNTLQDSPGHGLVASQSQEPLATGGIKVKDSGDGALYAAFLGLGIIAFAMTK